MRRLETIIMLVLILAIGPVTGTMAESGAEAGKTSIFVLLDRGDPATMTDKQYEMRMDIGEWMERDLVNILRKKKFDSSVIQKPEEYTPGPGKYLLSIKIMSYNPGSKAARIIVGFGAGAASLDIHYEFTGEGAAEPLISKDDGVGSGRDWRNCARKLNENIAKGVMEKLKP